MCELIQVQALALLAWASFVAELLFRKRCAALVNGARCMQLLPVMIDAHVKYNVYTVGEALCRRDTVVAAAC